MRQLRIGQSITLRESPSLEKYLQDISKVPMISAEEEVRLAALIRKGDQSALEKLTKANLRFVVSVAKQYQHQGLSLSDLINEGNLGLIRASKRFDETKGFRFISYAVWWIRQSILQALADQSRIVRVPLNRVGVRNKIARAAQHLEQDFEREPTAEEISEYLEMDLEEVSSTINLANRHVSIDSPVGEDGEGTMIDVMENKEADAADHEIQHESMHYEIELALRSLPEKQQKVIRCLYGIGMDRPMGMEDIGVECNITRERVRQIRDKALDALRFTANTMRLRTFL
ncbi:MAG: RNA polymerase sigma factor RpoD/SigA [bacterium]